MTQTCHHLGFLVEALPKLVVVADRSPQDLQGVEPRQPRVLSEIHLTHSPDAEDALNRVAGEDLAVR